MERTPKEDIRTRVYQLIFRDIMQGTFPMNEYLTEKALMEKYNVSRAPVREALMQLRSDGLIDSIPRHGYRIHTLDHRELCDSIELRSVLECTYLEYYHKMITADDITELRELCFAYNNIENCEDQFANYWKVNATFHVKLFSCYGNRVALQMLTELLNHQFIYFVEVMKNSFLPPDMHCAMLDYIEKGNIATAIPLLRADIEKIPSNEALHKDRKGCAVDAELYKFSLC